MKNNSQNFNALGKIVLKQLTNYLSESQSGKGKVLQLKPMELLSKELHLEDFLRKGLLNETNIENFLTTYFKNTQHLHHPSYMGHQVAVPHIAGAMADFIHGLTNNPMALYEMGPAASAMEAVVINWMLEKTGWREKKNLEEIDYSKKAGAGVMTHGGSLANLTALLAARAAVAPKAWEEGNPKELVVLAPATAHYSIARAISIMGLGKNAIIPIPVNQHEVILPATVPSIIKKVKSQGKKIMAVIANACTTSTGLHDPLEEIGQICEAYNLWFHVDSPHGAPALVSEKEKGLLKGIERANSMLWDAHKMMRTSSLSTAVLFRERWMMEGAFQQNASYIFHEKKPVGPDFIPYTVECTKAGLGMKLFWVLAAIGEKGLAEYVENLYEKTRQFYHQINARPNFECPYFPESNVLCFQYGKNENRQLPIRNRVVEHGNFYITSTNVNGKRYLRLTVMNPLTNEETIDGLLNEIEEIGEELSNSKIEAIG